MADKNAANKQANQFVNQHGQDVAKMPGGLQFMGFNKEGPAKGGIGAQAQAHVGDLKPGCVPANLQHQAMKK